MADMFTHGMGYISRVTMNIGIFVAIFLINKVVFAYYFFTALILTFLYAIKTKKLEKLNFVFRKQGDKVSNLIGELVKGEKDLKMLSAKETFRKKLDYEIIDKNNKNYKERSTERIFVWGINSVRDLFVFVLIFILIYLTKQNQLSAALAVALFTYKTNIMTNFMDNISLLFDEIKDFNVSCSRVFAVLNKDEFCKEKFNAKHIDKVEGFFEFKNVYFGYDDNYTVINNMSFKVNAGEIVAFVGKSGVGKSTVFNLLGKLYDIKSGEILIDGININTLDEESIRGNMTIISQNPYIFNMSIRDNFKLVKEDITDEEITQALKIACIYDFINNLPNKLDTIIGEGGNNLSGGQKQRIAIARALIQNTRIILFDEATSSLDNATQKDIQTAIDNLKGKYTIMIIAHRLSTIINADKIFLIEDGTITAQGTHMELLEKNETYRSLYKSF